jgi:predicted glycoside hydrolase/deacetylase ChbG (UPF0249 family)
MLDRLPQGTWELVCHPAYLDAELAATRTRLQQSRQAELTSLQSLPAMLAGLGSKIESIHFGQLSGEHRAQRNNENK